MAFNIPKGKDYTFSITVLAKDSFLPKDLATMDATKTSFQLVNINTLISVVGAPVISRIEDPKLLPTDPATYLNGKISVVLPSVMTATLEFERGDKIDGYYAIPTYEGVVSVGFTDGSSDIVAVVSDICVIPVGI